MDYRLATPADLDGCLALEWTRTREDVLWHIQAGLIFVVASERGVEGYLRLESFWKDMPYLALVTLREDTRGKGHGRALLAVVRADLVQRGYRYLLSSTTSGEEGPRRWHLRNGFLDIGTLASLNADGNGEIFYRLALR